MDGAEREARHVAIQAVRI